MPQGSAAGSSVVNVYNILLTLAQSERPDDPVLSKMSEISGQTHAATLRVLVGQIIAAFQR